ncbi:MAG: diguanylate cyclase [Acholeplasmataceae bacterium]|nr:diguanylate cyclase [Acholeplasmataceae bacterium]
MDGEINASRQMTDYTSLVLPVYDQDMIAGFILCDINMPLLILSINDEFEGDYMIQVFDGDQLVASSEHWQQPKVDVSVESDISFKSRNYRFVLTPTETIISFSTRNSVWIAVFGLSLSVLVAAIWYATSMSSIRLEGLVAKRTKELNYLTNHDFLTDLSNRRYYYEQFKKLDQPAYYPIGIMMLDVNGLKIINDAFGHTVGDKALRMMGRILDDIFEGMDVVARIGGDEFAVLLPNSSLEKLEHYKETIKEAVKKHKINNIELSLAIGFELKNSTEEAIDDILKIAENHMYRHKTTEGSSVRNRAISAILKTLTDKYHIEREHAFRVSHLCKAIGQHLNLRDDELNELEQAGLLHDIGKISIPDVILNKPSKLTEEEFQIIKSHTEIGYQILKAADEYSGLAIHALHHHERWDGKGYPGGLKGKDIPLFSRIICIVDAYEAMTADRPYRKKMTKEYAISEIKRCSGTQFDPDLATKFIEKVLETQ